MSVIDFWTRLIDNVYCKMLFLYLIVLMDIMTIMYEISDYIRACLTLGASDWLFA